MVKSDLKKAEFLFSKEIPPLTQEKQIAIVGRSNVGKSSLINHFFQKKNLAKAAKKPGKTKLLNYFKSEDLLFVDLPGYGFAKAPQKERAKWGEMMEKFFIENKQLAAILFLIDIRRDLTNDDILMQEWIESHDIRPIYVLTKIDKLKPNEVKDRSMELKEALGSPDAPFIHYSILFKHGREHLKKEILSIWD